MDASAALSVVIVVLGTSLLWVAVLWYVVGLFARTTTRVLENQQALERRIWLKETAGDPHQAAAAGQLALAEDPPKRVPAVPHGPFTYTEEARMAQ